jgi:hypothetical protein
MPDRCALHDPRTGEAVCPGEVVDVTEPFTRPIEWRWLCRGGPLVVRRCNLFEQVTRIVGQLLDRPARSSSSFLDDCRAFGFPWARCGLRCPNPPQGSP